MLNERFQEPNRKWGLTILMVLILAISFFFIVYRWSVVAGFIGRVNGILMPFVYGLAMAYLISPVYNKSYYFFDLINWPKVRGRDIGPRVTKILSVFVAMLTLLLFIAALLWLILPQLIESITTISRDLPATVDRAVLWVNEKFDALPDMTKQFESLIHQAGDSFTKWVEESLLPRYDTFIAGVSSGVISIARQILNFLIGFIICAFFTARKEVFIAQCKKLVMAVFSKETGESIIRGAAFTNKTFLGFLTGKIIDSFIIGIICFAVMALLHWPYAALISVIIGVTNIIPFFGPFIGAVPASLLILMTQPRLFWLFLLFVFILQQVDGNIIGPKILGDRTGLPSFWVMFAIILGGGLWGFAGMILGVPLFAVLYAYLCYWVDQRLQKKGMPVLTSDYKDLYHYDGMPPNERFYIEEGYEDPPEDPVYEKPEWAADPPPQRLNKL